MTKTSIKGIPREMKDLPQWVCFDVTDTGKTPFVAGAKSLASPNRPTDWRTFETAWKDVVEGRRTHVGFCFSSSDPYVFIDLDMPDDPDQAEVLARIDSYAQASVGGDGVHIICRGSFEGSGRHPKLPDAGIFQENRFCVMTGRSSRNDLL